MSKKLNRRTATGVMTIFLASLTLAGCVDPTGSALPMSSGTETSSGTDQHATPDRHVAADGSCTYDLPTPNPAYYQPGDPSEALTCTDYDTLVLGCYAGTLEDCDRVADISTTDSTYSYSSKLVTYGRSCGRRLRWSDDWPQPYSAVSSCTQVSWT